MIDAKNEMKRSIGELDGRIGELDRELRSALTSGLAGLRDGELSHLRSSQHETRTSAHKAAQKAGEAITAVTDLRRDLDRLHTGMVDLRGEVGEVLQLLREQASSHAEMAAAPAPVMVPAGALGSGRAPGVPLPGQRTDHDAEVLAAEVGEACQIEPGTPAHEEAGETPTRDQDGETAPPEDATEAQSEPDAAATHANAPEEGDETDQVTKAAEALVDGNGPSEPYPLSQKGRARAIMRASRVGQATLVCHRDAWEFISKQTASHPHFHTPATMEDRGNGLTAGTLSGRSLVAVLLSLFHRSQSALREEGADDLVGLADWALASELYMTIAKEVADLRAGAGEPIIITVDDRAPSRNAE